VETQHRQAQRQYESDTRSTELVRPQGLQTIHRATT